VIRVRRTSAISRCSRYQRPARADGLHEEIGSGEFGKRATAAAAAGHRVGEVGGHDVQDADPHQEVQQSRGQPVDHLVQQVRSDGVVVAGEPIDKTGGIGRVVQFEGGQPQPRSPPLGPCHQPPDVYGVQVDPELIEQGAGLVRPEGEVGCPDLAQHTGHA
jgi:hypothetical protein